VKNQRRTAGERWLERSGVPTIRHASPGLILFPTTVGCCPPAARLPTHDSGPSATPPACMIPIARGTGLLPPLVLRRTDPPAGQDRPGRVRGPLADRGQGPGPGQYGGHRRGQHCAQRVPPAASLSGVGELGEVIEQILEWSGASAAGTASRWKTAATGDAGQAGRQAGTAVRSGLVMSLETTRSRGAVPGSSSTRLTCVSVTLGASNARRPDHRRATKLPSR
jgi:hypothetical protein